MEIDGKVEKFIIQLLKESMGILKKVKDLIKSNDFFYSTEMLRFNDESEYKTLTGGLISLGIIITILVGFMSMIVQTLQLSAITSSTEVIKQQSPTPVTFSTSSQTNFMFGVSIPGVNLSSTGLFDVELLSQSRVINNNAVYTTIPLEKCTQQHWKGYPYVYQKLDVSRWLCAPINQTFEIEGKYTSQMYKRLIINVKPCSNSGNSSKICASSTTVASHFSNAGNLGEITLYVTNPVINPSKKDYKSYYLDDSNYITYSASMGCINRLYVTDYTVKTDNSIWPYENNIEDKGVMLEDAASSYPYTRPSGSIYATFFIQKSSNSIVYNRSVQKISAVFSFIGGMIGAVTAALFIINSYTSSNYEVSLALDVFQPSPESGLEKQGLVMNIWNYLRLCVYNFFSMIKRPLNWPKIEYIQQCQSEIVCQLDVKSLVKRLIFMQHCFISLFQDFQLDGLQIRKPKTPLDIKKIREKCEAVVSNEFESQHEVSSTSEALFKDDQLNDRGGSPNGLPHSKISPMDMSSSMKRDKISPVQMVINRNIEKTQDYAKTQQKRGKNDENNPGNRSLQKRNTLISKLKSSAVDGNQISKRIWQGLEAELAKKEEKRRQ